MEITRPLLFVGTLFFVAAILVLRFIGLKFSKEWWLRIGALTAGMISLSEPSLVTTTNALRVIFLLDRSASCRDYAHLAPQLVRQKISSLPPDANVVVGVFDRELEILYAGRADSFPVHLRTGDFLREGSELSNALRVVASQTKESEKVTVYLFGDGNYTRSPSEILPQNLLKRFVLHAIPLPRQRDASISAVHLPTLKAKQNATLYVSLSSNYETEATLDVLLPDGNKKRFPLRLTKGITKLGIPFLVPDTDSIVSLSLESPGDSDDTNNEALVRVKPSGRVRILYVASAKNRPLRRALEDVYSGNVLWLPPQALPQDSEPLKEFDCIVLDEVPSNLLAAGFASAVLESVERCGVGFVMLGVNSSFGAGSYANSPIEKLLPVNCTPRERIPLALTLLLDKSDSMGKEVVTSEGRRTKFEIAVESAISALGALKKGDSLAVLLFSSRPYRIRPLSRINSEGEIKATSHEIRRISPGDSTFLFTALEVALKEYENVDKGYRKAILLVSDGKSMEEKKIEYEMFKRKDVAVYSVGIGEDRNRALLSEISARTGGAYYEASFDPYDMRETFFNVVKEIEKYTSEIGEYEVSVKEGMMSLPAVRLYLSLIHISEP
ncbi:MAG: VWA domain-containing protein, partial [Planctomycetota bacterium]|nr:VWA domain-containing protein [Planctomycetota bacterium]